MTVKANMPTLYKQLKKLPWTCIPLVSSVSTDHGSRARRTVKAALAPTWAGFDGAAQVAQLRRTVTKKGKKTVEIVYLITSDRDADPETLAAWVRSHWHIENKLHWVRDVTYREDKSLVRTGNAPRVMATLRRSCSQRLASPTSSAVRHHRCTHSSAGTSRDQRAELEPIPAPCRRTSVLRAWRANASAGFATADQLFRHAPMLMPVVRSGGDVLVEPVEDAFAADAVGGWLAGSRRLLPR